jgi:hypothetical protein
MAHWRTRTLEFWTLSACYCDFLAVLKQALDGVQRGLYALFGQGEVLVWCASALPQKSITVITSFVSNSCDFVDRPFAREMRNDPRSHTN